MNLALRQLAFKVNIKVDLFTSFEKDKRFEVKKAFHLFTENKMYKTNGCFKEN